MRFWETLKQVFTLPDLRKKILYTIGLLVIGRILAHVPLPGVDLEALRSFFGRSQIFGLLNMFSGGAMENFSLIMMGVGPYITASIIMQLLTMIIPTLEELNKEGEAGRAKINHWTRMIAVPLAIVQAYGTIKILQGQHILQSLTSFEWAIILISVTAGSILLMWIGELITENGIGNGVSLIITLGILAQIPAQIRNTATIINASMITSLLIFIGIAILVIVGIILANEGTRQIQVSYARRVRGLRSYGGGVNTYMPIRVNSAGVVPIIFAMSIMLLPNILANVFQHARSPWLANFSLSVERILNPNGWVYGVTYFVVVVLFTYFYIGVIFKPDQMAENLQKQGGFVPGIRPGHETAEYLSKTIGYLTFWGAIFLGVIAILPFVMQAITKVNTLVLGGTGVLIMVSVIIETMRQVQAQLSMRTYEKY